jgi:hypothetical protein
MTPRTTIAMAAHKGFGRGALMGIQIASLTWQLLVGMGAQDEVVMTKGGMPTGLQSFVPFPLMPIFDMASTKQILLEY